MTGFEPSLLSIEQKIGQLFFVGVPGAEFDAATKRIIDEIQPGGVCLFARNIKTLKQTRELLDLVHNALSVTPLLSLDQEGGRVDRLRRVMPPMPAAASLQNEGEALESGDIIGETIRLLGFNMNFAPVVDVIDGSRKDLINGLQSRGFGSSENDVVSMAGAFLEGMGKHKILGCIKHFPGLAAAAIDSHEDLPIVPVKEEELRQKDLIPYVRLIKDRPNIAVMVAHAAYPATDLQETDVNGKLLPSSLSRRVVTSLLRDELNFKGVTISDDMEMGAIVRNYGIGEACKMAINAGQDMLAICSSVDAIYEGYEVVKDAVASGEISEDQICLSLDRISRIKAGIGDRAAFDQVRLMEISERIRKLNQHVN
jgi:beta-N-acetylhexosaminidase